MRMSFSQQQQVQQPPPQPSQQQFCLRWNNYQSNLTSVFDQLLQNEAFVDVTLACDGRSLKCHKMVLSACSPYFQALLFDNPCQHPIVILQDVRFSELKPIIEFMYRGEINVSQEQIPSLLRVAEALRVRGLAEVRNDEDAPPDEKSWPVHLAPNVEISAPRRKKRQYSGGEGIQGEDSMEQIESSVDMPTQGDTSTSLPLVPPAPAPSSSDLNPAGHHMFPLNTLPRVCSTPNPSPTDTPTPSITPSSLPDQRLSEEQDIKPGIVELIREEERAKILENVKMMENSLFDPSQLHSSLAWTQLHQPLMQEGRGDLSDDVDAAFGRSRQGSKWKWTEGEMQNALQLVKDGVPIQRAALQYKIPVMTLWRRAHISGLTSSRSFHKRAYSAEAAMSHSSIFGIPPELAEVAVKEEPLTSVRPEALQLAETYQYQMQSLWQKAWSQNNSLLQAWRFRERGPLKSWKPETMALAIRAVLHEGLSLSQAARKYDIPYPTFVLYANRVHNMLGPSPNGSELRPKGRGRPQRILLGSWSEQQIANVIRTVIFRDSSGNGNGPGSSKHSDLASGENFADITPPVPHSPDQEEIPDNVDMVGPDDAMLGDLEEDTPATLTALNLTKCPSPRNVEGILESMAQLGAIPQHNGEPQ